MDEEEEGDAQWAFSLTGNSPSSSSSPLCCWNFCALLRVDVNLSGEDEVSGDDDVVMSLGWEGGFLRSLREGEEDGLVVAAESVLLVVALALVVVVLTYRPLLATVCGILLLVTTSSLTPLLLGTVDDDDDDPVRGLVWPWMLFVLV